MTWTEIKKPDVPYMTLVQSLIARGDEFMDRGDSYWADGKKAHAEGCWKKAEKKYKRASALEAWGLK